MSIKLEQAALVASVDAVRATAAGLRPLYFVHVTMAEHQIEIAFPSYSVHQLTGNLENHGRGQRHLWVKNPSRELAIYCQRSS